MDVRGRAKLRKAQRNRRNLRLKRKANLAAKALPPVEPGFTRVENFTLGQCNLNLGEPPKPLYVRPPTDRDRIPDEDPVLDFEASLTEKTEGD